ncbi:hypothetical protein Hanom_Chr17g01532771 [Helianthus anomalus]
MSENDFNSLEFVTNHAKCSYAVYTLQVKKLYGDKDCDDLAV